ncbi:MAG: hypothetical protein K1X54_06930 [Flavobacteriales bacterium]|nr:hypothetical protein [Flavobacteriales bacterium]
MRVTFAESNPFLMRVLILGSYLCAVLGAILLGIYFFFSIENDEWLHEGILKSFLLILPVFQFWYTKRTVGALHYPVFIVTESLDDFALNEGEIGDQHVTNHFFIKLMLTVNSAAMALSFYFIANSIFYVLISLSAHFGEKITGNLEDKIDALASIVIPLYFLSVIPAIIFNLRTYNVSRIVKASGS